MKANIRLSILFLFAITGCQNQVKDLKVISFNIRFDNPGDGVNAWPNRVHLVEAFLIEESPDIIGLQEALYHQVKELETMLPGYSWVGSGRKDGLKEGEFTPIFFNASVFELSEQGQFWLSETPEVIGSIGPGAILPRIATWAKLVSKPSGDTLYVFNTHYSHVSDEARRLGAEIMSEKMKQIAGEAPLILMGDFNIEYLSTTYDLVSQYFLDNNKLDNILELQKLTPCPINTYNGFSANNPGSLIDFIFVNDQFCVIDYRVRKLQTGEVYISDHWPISVLIEFIK